MKEIKNKFKFYKSILFLSFKFIFITSNSEIMNSKIYKFWNYFYLFNFFNMQIKYKRLFDKQT